MQITGVTVILEYQLKAMEMWFRVLPGALIVERELLELDRILPAIPGDVALQIGGPSNLRLLNKSKIPHVFYCSDQEGHANDSRVQCDYKQLPYETDSVHLVLVAHALEFYEEPLALLAEIYRVLKPGGQLIILGFNRWSSWSLVRWWKEYRGYPWLGAFHSIWRVRSWIDQIGYGVIANKSTFFMGPTKKRPSKKWLEMSEILGQVFIPKMGAIHLIYAQKKVAGITPLVKMWGRKRMRVRNTMVSSTNRAES